MDNLSPHKDSRVRELIEGRGCELIYLLPYSPDFNPIEEAFAKIKGILSKAQARSREALVESIGAALFSSVKRYATMVLPRSTEGKDNRRVHMTKIVLRHRTNLPYSVKTCPGCIRTYRFTKPLEDLQLLLLTEHHLPSGGTLELEHQIRLVTPELLLNLFGHPIEPCADLLLVSAREPDARAFWDLRLYGE
jgi:hypothetical protein